MNKKIIALVLCVLVAVSCMFACGTEEVKPTEAPATAAPTEAPATAAPTEAPTPAEPTATPIPRLEIDAYLTDLSLEIPISGFTKSASFAYSYSDVFGVITNDNADPSAYVSLRMYDESKDMESYGNDRSCCPDTTTYGFYAIKYKLTEGATPDDYIYHTSTWDTNILDGASPDQIEKGVKDFVGDGKWNIMIFTIAEDFPNSHAANLAGDAFDCLAIPAPAEEDAELCIAWYGFFKSVDDINAWDANYTARFAADMVDDAPATK